MHYMSSISASQLADKAGKPQGALSSVVVVQSDAFDMIALAVGIIATLRPAASVLFPTRRLPRLSQLYSWSSVIWTAVFIAVMYIVVFQLLDSQSWYTGGNGDDAQVIHVPVLTSAGMCCTVLFYAVLCFIAHFQASSVYVAAASYQLIDMLHNDCLFCC